MQTGTIRLCRQFTVSHSYI